MMIDLPAQQGLGRALHALRLCGAVQQLYSRSRRSGDQMDPRTLFILRFLCTSLYVILCHPLVIVCCCNTQRMSHSLASCTGARRCLLPLCAAVRVAKQAGDERITYHSKPVRFTLPRPHLGCRYWRHRLSGRHFRSPRRQTTKKEDKKSENNGPSEYQAQLGQPLTKEQGNVTIKGASWHAWRVLLCVLWYGREGAVASV